jgi:hypothetical protein
MIYAIPLTTPGLPLMDASLIGMRPNRNVYFVVPAELQQANLKTVPLKV